MPDARFVGRPHVDDDHRVVPDRVIDPTGGAGTGPATTLGGAPGSASGGRADADGTFGDHRTDADPTAANRRPDAGTTGPATARPGVATRLRRLARSITPTKDDHHG
ncbi:unannotated protein [freshwater metagenome]|uniref:Unannotated protein n=1 Tax=freshwater metagenome TaxID=449393 RepID=A0A6J7K2K0_9ZZZZ